MKKKLYLICLVLFCISLGGYFGRSILKDALAAIQSQVGINVLDTGTKGWIPIANYLGSANDNQDGGITFGGGAIQDSHAEIFGFNGVGYDRIRAGLTSDANAGTGLLNNGALIFNSVTWDRLRTASGDALVATGILGNGNLIFNGATFDRVRNASADGLAATGILGTGNLIFNGATWDRIRSPSADAVAITGTIGVGNLLLNNAGTFERLRSSIGATGTTGAGVVAVGTLVFDGTNYVRNTASAAAGDGGTGSSFSNTSLNTFNGATYDRFRSVSATNLTAATSTGSPLTVPLSTWSVTHSPAAAAQATASKAAGGGTVRHVTTSITGCYANNGSVTPDGEPLNLRDGATGAGTVKWSSLLGVTAIAGNTMCITLSGLSIIGSANTAMTLEFGAASAANVLQTVTLTGFSVP